MIHKPTLIKVLKILKEFSPEDPTTTQRLIEHVVANATKRDESLDPQKLLAGAGIL